MKSRHCIVVIAATLAPWVWFAGCSSAPLPESARPVVRGEQLPPAPPPTSAPLAASTPSASTIAATSSSAASSSSAAPTGSVATAGSFDPTKLWKFTGVVNNAKGKPVGFSVVYLEDGPIVGTRAATAAISNKDMSFIPFVSVVREGGSVTFVNEDPFPHNAYSPDNEKFNLGQFGKGAGRTHKFDKAGSYKILCNLHPGMLAYVVVIPSSFFAITNAKGQFTMKDVPEGAYKVVVWNRDGTTDGKSVTISGADATADFALHK